MNILETVGDDDVQGCMSHVSWDADAMGHTVLTKYIDLNNNKRPESLRNRRSLCRYSIKRWVTLVDVA